MDKAPLFTFGAIADIQYADLDDYYANYAGRLRFYRNSLLHTSQAIKEFEDLSASHILQLGDIIDGKNKKTATKALTSVLNVLSSTKIPVYHTVGNHELYNFTRPEILDLLFHGCKGYYSFEQVNFRFICLDTYDVSMLGIDKDGELYKELGEYLRSKNPNQCLNDPEGLNDVNRRFVQFNGALSGAQLSWLDEQLAEAVRVNQKVVIYGHTSFHPDVTNHKSLVWNYAEVLEKVENCPAVVLALSGHSHCYHSITSQSGKLYVSLPGVIETPPTGRGWCIVKVYTDGLDITVHDNTDSHRLAVSF